MMSTLQAVRTTPRATAGRQAALERAARHYDGGLFVSELARLVAVPTESEKPRGAHYLALYLTEHMRPMLEKMGFVCEVLLAPTSSSAAGCPACRARGLRKAHQGRLGEPFQPKCHSSVTSFIQKQDVNSPVTEDSVSRQQLDIEIFKCLKFERLPIHVHFAPYRYPA